jgi:hypothetical protein
MVLRIIRRDFAHRSAQRHSYKYIYWEKYIYVTYHFYKSKKSRFTFEIIKYELVSTGLRYI